MASKHLRIPLNEKLESTIERLPVMHVCMKECWLREKMPKRTGSVGVIIVFVVDFPLPAFCKSIRERSK